MGNAAASVPCCCSERAGRSCEGSAPLAGDLPWVTAASVKPVALSAPLAEPRLEPLAAVQVPLRCEQGTQTAENDGCVRVRNMAGDLLVCLTAGQADMMDVEQLRTYVQNETGKVDCFVSFLLGGEELSDAHFRAHLTTNLEPLELTMVVTSLPPMDAKSPIRKQLAAIKARLGVNNEHVQLKAMIHLRTMLSKEDNPPIDDVVKAGMLPVTLPYCEAGSESCPQLQHEALWAMTNVASGRGTHCRQLVDSGSLPIFLKALSSPKADIREQSVWALGNIAGDSANHRDAVIQEGAVPLLIETLRESLRDGPITLQRNCAWAIANLCRGRPQVAMELVRPFVPIISEALERSNDEDQLADYLWALSYIAEGPDERIAALTEEPGLVARLVPFLQLKKCILPALRAIGNIATGNEVQCQTIIDGGAVPVLKMLLDSPKKHARKEACWTLSNITAGSQSQIQRILDADVLQKVIRLLLNDTEQDVKREAIFVLANFADGGSVQQLASFVETGGVSALMTALMTAISGGEGARWHATAVKGLADALHKVMDPVCPLGWPSPIQINELEQLVDVLQIDFGENDLSRIREFLDFAAKKDGVVTDAVS